MVKHFDFCLQNWGHFQRWGALLPHQLHHLHLGHLRDSPQRPKRYSWRYRSFICTITGSVYPCNGQFTIYRIKLGLTLLSLFLLFSRCFPCHGHAVTAPCWKWLKENSDCVVRSGLVSDSLTGAPARRRPCWRCPVGRRPMVQRSMDHHHTPHRPLSSGTRQSDWLLSTSGLSMSLPIITKIDRAANYSAPPRGRAVVLT